MKDYDNETNLENYNRKPKFVDFVVPDDAQLVTISVDWDEAMEFANPEDEITSEEMAELGLDDA